MRALGWPARLRIARVRWRREDGSLCPAWLPWSKALELRGRSARRLVR